MLINCIYRESITSPLFVGKYNTDTGTIDNISKDKFFVQLDDDYYSKYESSDLLKSLTIDFAYDINMMYTYNALVCFNYYDIGIVLLSEDGIYIVTYYNNMLYYKGKLNSNSVLFDYNKIHIGIYKTKLLQLDYDQSWCYLNVDSNGLVLHEGNIVKFPYEDYKELNVKTDGTLIKALREDNDGVYYSKSGKFKPYKLR